MSPRCTRRSTTSSQAERPLNGTSATDGSIGRATTIATVFTVAGYATTLLQQMAYARVLGVGRETDALAAALAWATVVAGLVGTTFASVLVPAYLRVLPTSPSDAAHQFRTGNAMALGIAAIVGTFTLALGARLAPALVPGADAGTMDLLARLLRLAAPLIVLWVMIATFTALANARERYGVAAASSIVPSLVVVAALVLQARVSAESVMVAYLAGAIAQLLVLGYAVRRWIHDLVPRAASESVAGLMRDLLPVGLALAIVNFGILIARAIASLGDPGDVAIVDYALRLVGAAEAALLTGALAVALTAWSLDAGDPSTRRLPVGSTIRTAVGLLIPMTLIIAIVAPELVSVLFGGGRFTANDAAAVGTFLRWMMPGVAGHLIIMLAFRALLAGRAFWWLVMIGVVQVVVLSVVSLATRGELGVNSVALGFTTSWVAAGVAAVWAIKVTMDPDIRVGDELMRTLIASLLAATGSVLCIAASPGEPIARAVVGVATFTALGLAFGHLLRVDFVRTLETQMSSALRGREAGA